MVEIMNRCTFVSIIIFLLSSSCVGKNNQKPKAEGGMSREQEQKTMWKPSVHKCCPMGEALFHGKGCIKARGSPSSYLTYLQNTMGVRYGFPVPKDTCEMRVLKRNIDVEWWISRTGRLAMKAPQGELAIQNYCIDDLLDPLTREASPTAVTCRHKHSGKLQVPLPLSAFKQLTVGKCCARHNYMSKNSSKCEHSSKGLAPTMELSVPGFDNETQLGYTGFPKCPDGYSVQLFDVNSSEYVRIEKNLSLVLVKMDGHCVENQTLLGRMEYCFDYTKDSNGTTKPVAVVCRLPPPPPLATPRAPLLAALLSVATVALLLTMVFLVALQAKGIVHHVPQSGPLAPRTHLTYVGSMVVTCAVFASAISKPASDSTGCWATAGSLMFFCLASYHWNTALCLESMLITMRLGTPGLKRYLIHSVWAWGLPALVTAIALGMDARRTQYACGTLTPRVGARTCFFSEPAAQLLYLYLPIGLTLLANVVFLFAARHIRAARLRRLELGSKHHHKKHAAHHGGKHPEEGEFPRRPLSALNSSAKGSNSSIAKFGIGTRETQKLWLETMYLGLWSGFTWLIEVIGFAVTTLGKPTDEHIWYFPSSMSALRGFGVFFILVVLPKDSRSYLLELLSNLWELCGGKPIPSILPSTRRSSTSTNATSATTATASTAAVGDKERISLSSSESQMSSNAASMSELHDLSKPGSAVTSNKHSANLEARGSFSVGDSVSQHNRKSSLKSTSKSEDLTSTYSVEEKDSKLPKKPPRKSLDQIVKASAMKTTGLNHITETQPSKQLDSDSPHTPPKTPSPNSKSKLSHGAENLTHVGSADQLSSDGHKTTDTPPKVSPLRGIPLEGLQCDSSCTDTPPDSRPPSPPTSPPPALQEPSQTVIINDTSEGFPHLTNTGNLSHSEICSDSSFNEQF